MRILLNRKKGATALRGLKFIIAVFGIVIMLTFFYVWVQQNVSKQSKEQAETVASEVEFRAFFSELVSSQGIQIANEDESDVEDAIEKFAIYRANVEKGDYDASCDKTNEDKECTLEITINPNVSAVWTATFFTGIAAYTLPAYVLMKLIGLDVIKENIQETYLPVKGGKIMKFKLTTTVEMA
jgi:hypothetical protein